MIYFIFIPYRFSYFLHYTPDSAMGNLLCGCSLLGSSVPFPLPNLQKCRTFEIRLHCNDHSWCSPAMCASSYQCGIWIWHSDRFTHEVWISCTRCGFLYWCIDWRSWTCHIRNSAGNCLLEVGEGMYHYSNWTYCRLQSLCVCEKKFTLSFAYI